MSVRLGLRMAPAWYVGQCGSACTLLHLMGMWGGVEEEEVDRRRKIWMEGQKEGAVESGKIDGLTQMVSWRHASS